MVYFKTSQILLFKCWLPQNHSNRWKHRNRHIDTLWMSLDTPAQMAAWAGKAICCCASPQAGNKYVCLVSRWTSPPLPDFPKIGLLILTRPTHTHKQRQGHSYILTLLTSHGQSLSPSRALQSFTIFFLSLFLSHFLTHTLTMAAVKRFPQTPAGEYRDKYAAMCIMIFCQQPCSSPRGVHASDEQDPSC